MSVQLNTVDEIISDVRQGRMVVLLDDDSESANEGVVMVAAEHVTAAHITFMARQARGLVCLALTQERCRQLDLPPMVAGADGEQSSFMLSIEAAEGIDTGISAADRAHTVRVAVAPHAVPDDVVQPGHIFPLTSRPGGVLVRAGHTEAACDYARLAGLMPAGVIADVLDADGELADGPALASFAGEHGLKIGSIADLIEFRVVNERTVNRIRDGLVQTAYGEFSLRAYREETTGKVHLALCKGEIGSELPVLVRVHLSATLRDLAHCELEDKPSWSTAKCLQHVAEAGQGVIVLISSGESSEDLLTSVDVALGNEPGSRLRTSDHYTNVGVGSQILLDCGVSKIRLMGAPIKYNAISGFGLEVVEYLQPDREPDTK